MAGELTNKDLARKIRGRKNFLDKTVDAVINLVCNRGKVLSRSEHSAHTHIIWELHNFGGFSFRTDLGQTMFGGNTVKVYYHPGRSFREGGLDSAWDKDCSPVLIVYFPTEGDYKVGQFNEKTDWQRALIRVLKNQNNIAAQINKAKEKENKTLQKWSQKDEKNAQLIKEAQKLGITPR